MVRSRIEFIEKNFSGSSTTGQVAEVSVLLAATGEFSTIINGSYKSRTWVWGLIIKS